MLSPESYIAELQDAPYEQLVRERRSIIAELERQEKGFKDPQPTAWECLDPGQDVEYKMDLEYLRALTGLMLKRAGEITGMGLEEDELDEEGAEGDEPKGKPFASVWDPETAEWSHPLPLS